MCSLAVCSLNSIQIQHFCSLINSRFYTAFQFLHFCAVFIVELRYFQKRLQLWNELCRSKALPQTDNGAIYDCINYLSYCYYLKLLHLTITRNSNEQSAEWPKGIKDGSRRKLNLVSRSIDPKGKIKFDFNLSFRFLHSYFSCTYLTLLLIDVFLFVSQAQRKYSLENTMHKHTMQAKTFR